MIHPTCYLSRTEWFGSAALTLAVVLLPPAVIRANAQDRRPARTGAIIRIHGEITPTTVGSLRRRIDDARSIGAEALIFELNTPGGRLDSAIDICDLIKNQADVQTIAWVNTTAHSAGALIAVACDEIVMARSSRIGDSQALLGGPLGVMPIPEELQPKVLTPLLAEFDASAKLHGYSPVLCEAFVRPELQVWWIEHTETGERTFVFQEEKFDRLESRDSKWKLVETYYDEILGAETKADQPIVRDDRLLQMSAGQAIAYGFCKAMIPNEPDLVGRYGLASLVRVEPSWSENLAAWMTSIWVRGFLLVIILLGAYVEFNTPGVGVPGLVALICLAIFVGAPYLTGLANIWELLFILAGIALIAVELFAFPGFGVAGIAGILLIFLGLLGTFVPDEPGRSFPIYIPRLDSTIEGLKIALMTLTSSTALSIAGIFVLSRYLPRMPVLAGLMPPNPTPSDVAVDDPYHGLARVGDRGVTASPLAPGGKARFQAMLVDVVTEGDFVEPGTPVEVIEHRGNHVVVRVVT